MSSVTQKGPLGDAYANRTIKYVQITINDTAQTLSSADYEDARRAIICVENAPIRIRTDGQPATANVGLPISAGEVLVLEGTFEIHNLSVIASTSVDALLNIEFKR
jgi:hypothetical protein